MLTITYVGKNKAGKPVTRSKTLRHEAAIYIWIHNLGIKHYVIEHTDKELVS